MDMHTDCAKLAGLVLLELQRSASRRDIWSFTDRTHGSSSCQKLRQWRFWQLSSNQRVELQRAPHPKVLSGPLLLFLMMRNSSRKMAGESRTWWRFQSHWKQAGMSCHSGGTHRIHLRFGTLVQILKLSEKINKYETYTESSGLAALDIYAYSLIIKKGPKLSKFTNSTFLQLALCLCWCCCKTIQSQHQTGQWEVQFKNLPSSEP